MLIWWVKKPTRELAGQGYFNCPRCACRTPCELIRSVAGGTYLFGFIPFSLSMGDPGDNEIYHCLRCESEYTQDPSIAFAFSEQLETPSWKCFKCECEIPYEEFECPRCGYRFDAGR